MSNSTNTEDIARHSASTGPHHAWILEGLSSDALWSAAVAKCADFQTNRLADETRRDAVVRKVRQGAHPDILTLRSDDKLIPVADVRALRSEMWIVPNEGIYKIAVIGDAVNLAAPAQNALLTLLEEPPPYGIILLLTTSRSALLPTIRSRCVCETVAGDAAVLTQDDTAAHLLAALTAGNELGVFRAVTQWDKLPRAAFTQELDGLTAQLTLMLTEGKPLPRARVLSMLEAVSYFRAAQSVNAGIGHSCGALAARLWLAFSGQ